MRLLRIEKAVEREAECLGSEVRDGTARRGKDLGEGNREEEKG